VAAYVHKNKKKNLSSMFQNSVLTSQRTLFPLPSPIGWCCFGVYVIAVYCEHNTKYINAFCEQHAVFNVTAGRTRTASTMLQRNT